MYVCILILPLKGPLLRTYEMNNDCLKVDNTKLYDTYIDVTG